MGDYDFLKLYDGVLCMYVCMYVCGWVCICFGFLYFVCVWVSTWYFEVDVSENQNCGSGWKDNQAADCELKLFFFFFFFCLFWFNGWAI